ncbi:cell wall hydrolase [Bacillus sp. FJAT-45350]|uniref:cell wall hydrolase n=1 Tax=Bacillus sp. FJAT-45350 TaxID=2011014 RepID=UPI000BB6BC67|nr:cell wall hydrolase [Bacillus sp. FJAT-45350]
MLTIITSLLLMTGIGLPEVDDTLLIPKYENEIIECTIDTKNERLEELVENLETIDELEERVLLTDEEIDMLERLVTAEAKSEPLEGQVAVAEVVLNRMESEQFPDELEEVVYEKDQFSPVTNGSINNEPTENAKQAVEEALSGTNEANGAIFFYNDTIIKKSWLETRQTTTRIGEHVFKL